MDLKLVAMKIASSDSIIAKKKVAPKSKKKTKKFIPEIEEVEDQGIPVEEESILREDITEYACQLSFSINVQFEGNASKKSLIAKLKQEVQSGIESSLKIVDKEFEDLILTKATVTPIKIDCAINSV